MMKAESIGFIVEIFNIKLATAVALQRLLTTIVRDKIYELSPKNNGVLRREGDDLFWNQKKLSISSCSTPELLNTTKT